MFKLTRTVGFISKIRSTHNAIVTNVSGKFARFEKKVEGTIVEKWLFFWKAVFRDYKDVAIEVVKECKEKPSKAILISTGLGLTVYCAKHNPNEMHFKDTFIRSSNEVALVHHSLVNPEVANHIKYLERCFNNGLVRYTSLGVISFIWIDNHSNKCSAFENQCSYLQLKYTEIPARIIDVGFVDTWWIISRKMTDYDINY